MKKAFSIIQETFLIHFRICSKHVFWRLREENKGVDGKGSFWSFGVLAQHTQHVFYLSFEISLWFNWFCKSLVRLLHVWLCYGLVEIFFPLLNPMSPTSPPFHPKLSLFHKPHRLKYYIHILNYYTATSIQVHLFLGNQLLWGLS